MLYCNDLYCSGPWTPWTVDVGLGFSILYPLRNGIVGAFQTRCGREKAGTRIESSTRLTNLIYLTRIDTIYSHIATTITTIAAEVITIPNAIAGSSG